MALFGNGPGNARMVVAGVLVLSLMLSTFLLLRLKDDVWCSSDRGDAAITYAAAPSPPGKVLAATTQGPRFAVPSPQQSALANNVCPLDEIPFPLSTVDIRLDRSAVPAAGFETVKWNMLVHSASKDWISGGALQDHGRNMFENFLKVHFFRALRPTDGLPVPRDPLVLDVGGNIGIHTLFFGALNVRTHAFEPVRSNYALLACSVAANKGFRDVVTVNNFGLSDRDVVSQCFAVENGNQGHAFVKADANCDPSLSTSMLTMDGYWVSVLKKERPFMIKVDIEGYEPFFFKGGKQMLKIAPPVFIYMELSPFASKSYGVDVKQFVVDLIADGWSVDILRGDRTFASGRPTPMNGRIQGDQVITDLANSQDGHIFDLRLTHEPTFAKYKSGELKF